MNGGRRTFITGTIPSRKEEYAALKERLTFARLNTKEHASHANEIAELYADMALEAFLEANPTLAETERPQPPE